MKLMLVVIALFLCRTGVGQTVVPPTQFPDGILVGGPGVLGDATKNGHVSLSQSNTGKDVVTSCVTGSACLDMIGGVMTLTDASGGKSPVATKADIAAAIAALTPPPVAIPPCSTSIIPGSVPYTPSTPLLAGVLMYSVSVVVGGKPYPIVYVCMK